MIATWDRTLPTVIACVDRAMRTFGGAPTYWLTDNERTVKIDHVAGIAVRHPEMVAASGHYGITVATCVPADPESKGGSEATVQVAKADLVPTATSPVDEVASGFVVGRVAALVASAEPGELGSFPASGLPPGHPARLHLEPTSFAFTSMLSSTATGVVRDPHVLHPAASAADRVALHGSCSG